MSSSSPLISLCNLTRHRALCGPMLPTGMSYLLLISAYGAGGSSARASKSWRQRVGKSATACCTTRSCSSVSRSASASSKSPLRPSSSVHGLTRTCRASSRDTRIDSLLAVVASQAPARAGSRRSPMRSAKRSHVVWLTSDASTGLRPHDRAIDQMSPAKRSTRAAHASESPDAADSTRRAISPTGAQVRPGDPSGPAIFRIGSKRYGRPPTPARLSCLGASYQGNDSGAAPRNQTAARPSMSAATPACRFEMIERMAPPFRGGPSKPLVSTEEEVAGVIHRRAIVANPAKSPHFVSSRRVMPLLE